MDPANRTENSLDVSERAAIDELRRITEDHQLLKSLEARVRVIGATELVPAASSAPSFPEYYFSERWVRDLCSLREIDSALRPLVKATITEEERQQLSDANFFHKKVEDLYAPQIRQFVFQILKTIATESRSGKTQVVYSLDEPVQKWFSEVVFEKLFKNTTAASLGIAVDPVYNGFYEREDDKWLFTWEADNPFLNLWKDRLEAIVETHFK